MRLALRVWRRNACGDGGDGGDDGVGGGVGGGGFGGVVGGGFGGFSASGAWRGGGGGGVGGDALEVMARLSVEAAATFSAASSVRPGEGGVLISFIVVVV